MKYVCDDCGELDEDEVVAEGAGKCPNCGKDALPMDDGPRWPGVMRLQVRELRQMATQYMPADSPFLPLAKARCDILLDYIDDLEKGLLPTKERPARG